MQNTSSPIQMSEDIRTQSQSPEGFCAVYLKLTLFCPEKSLGIQFLPPKTMGSHVSLIFRGYNIL